FAFRKALDIHADVIEFDVHLTRDGHPVSEVDPKSRTNGTRY
ncbi:MAG: glycerophosphodiester phosphodiesterase, partial [Victivallales bacterium]|nr:glycerophosphodiester phosphodiesterase [Victivallales bacterium]